MQLKSKFINLFFSWEFLEGIVLKYIASQKEPIINPAAQCKSPIKEFEFCSLK